MADNDVNFSDLNNYEFAEDVAGIRLPESQRLIVMALIYRLSNQEREPGATHQFQLREILLHLHRAELGLRQLVNLEKEMVGQLKPCHKCGRKIRKIEKVIAESEYNEHSLKLTCECGISFTREISNFVSAWNQ